MNKLCFIILYFCLISAVAICLTVSDKKRAKGGKYRIPEKTLMSVGFFGGALAMFVTMKSIRHKTKHNKFMIGLPIIIIMQIVFVGVLIYMIMI